MSSKNNDGKIVMALIISLIAFGLGSGIGITVGMSGDGFNTTDSKPVNDTIDVTDNISQDNPYYNMKVYPYEEEANESNQHINSNYFEEKNYYSEDEYLEDSNNNYQSITIG